MGSLQRFDLRKYADRYGLSVFFETGTFRGAGVRRALECSFTQIFSVEIIDEFYDEVAAEFDDVGSVKLVHGDSVAALAENLPAIDGSIFFWLDAHFPGADGGLQVYNSSYDEAIRLPLESEIRTIKKLRDDRKDVILIDDLRIYETGEYERGNLPAEIKPPAVSGIDFIFDLFGESHHILRLGYDEGYLLLLPNSAPPKIYVTRKLSEFDSGKPRISILRKLVRWLKSG